MRRGRARTFEERKARSIEVAVNYARSMGPVSAARALFHEERMLGLNRQMAENAQTLSDLYQKSEFASRGSKWSATYHLRRANESVEISEAVVAALREQASTTTDCPAG